jgi:hypothetical protein
MAAERDVRRAFRGLALCATLGLLPIGAPNAQSAAVLLQLRPRSGDTLRLRMDQTVEMAGMTRQGEIDVTNSESHTLVMLSRIAVEATDLDGATVTAATDSVRVVTSNGGEPNPLLGWARAMQGHRVRFRVALDGSTSLVGPDKNASPRVSSFLAQLPATLPREPITIGTTWTRAMEIPLSGADTRGSALMTATFRFDSLSRSGDLAWLSMTGRVTRTITPRKGVTGPDMDMTGSVSGSVTVDRRRGWITDARTLITVRSLIFAAKSGSAVKVRTKITQWMRVL